MLSTSKRVGPLVLAAAFVFAACSSSGNTPAPTTGASTAPAASQAAVGSMAAPACATGSTTAAGSTALQPVVDAAGKQYVAACAGSTVSVQGGGSGTGLTQVLQGAVNIGNSDVKAEDKLKPDEAAQLVDHIIAKQGWVMVVNPSVTGVTNLTTQQATDIWTGKITNWKEIPGGNDQAIVLIIRPASSGTRAVFKSIVLGGAEEAAGQALTEDSNGAVTTAVAGTPGATSVIGFAYYQANKGTVTPLQLDGVDPSVDNIKNGTYKLQADGHSYTKGQPDGITKSFIDYLLSPDVQNTLLPNLGYAGAGQ